MNAAALLTSQGWRGAGHSLHKTDDSIGLAKPILVSRKDNKKGLGQKQHFTSDQWWLNAFDEQLKGLDTSKKDKVVQTVTSGKLNGIETSGLGKWSLYASFVRGGFLDGTVSTPTDSSSQDSSSDSADASKKKSNKSKSSETPEERHARKEAKKLRKLERATRRAAKAARRERKKKSSAEGSTDDAAEEKRRRRAKKEEKRRKRLLKAEKKS
jgi:nucleolar protein TMA23